MVHAGDPRKSVARRGRRLALGLAGSLVGLVVAAWSGGASAGPPFLTDDPEPTDPGHWELYAPVEAAGRGSDFAGSAGIEVNYGAAPGLQLTAALPEGYARSNGKWHSGAADVELAVKYRFVQDEHLGLQIAAFPGITLPTGTHNFSAGKVTALLPLWFQEDVGHWSFFGGGGRAINPGEGNRDYWTGGIAASRELGKHWLLGVEADRDGADEAGGAASTSLGAGAIYRLKAPFKLLASAGPTLVDHHGGTLFHAYLALGIDY